VENEEASFVTLVPFAPCTSGPAPSVRNILPQT
jgi:hypothetical protein